ncbi:MAG: hypothetical protein ABIR59_13310 [Gemmatimonadales bacterium]
MASIDAQVKKLVKQVTALKKALAKEKLVSADLLQKQREVVRWIKLEVKWSKQVTALFHQVDWEAVAEAYPSKAMTGNPPQTPPDWPVD